MIELLLLYLLISLTYTFILPFNSAFFNFYFIFFHQYIYLIALIRFYSIHYISTILPYYVHNLLRFTLISHHFYDLL